MSEAAAQKEGAGADEKAAAEQQAQGTGGDKEAEEKKKADDKGLQFYGGAQEREEPGEMSEKEANMLLEGYKGEEATGRAIRMRRKPVQMSEPVKDW